MENEVYSIEEIKNILMPVFEQYGVKKAVLFGSYAKNKASVSSDVDLFIDSGGVLCGFNFFEAYGAVEERLNKKVDLIEAIDIDRDSVIYSEIEKSGVVLYEQGKM